MRVWMRLHPAALPAGQKQHIHKVSLELQLQHLQVKPGPGTVTGLGHNKKWPRGKGQEGLLIWKNKPTKKRWAIAWAKANSLRKRACCNFCTWRSRHRADGDEAQLLTWRKGRSQALASRTGDARGTHGGACRGSRTDCRERLAGTEEGLMKGSWQTSRES